MPFVALQLYDDSAGLGDGDISKANLRYFMLCTLSVWLLTNVAFFSTINLSYVNTFFGRENAVEYTVDLFLTANDDKTRFRAVFRKRASYTMPIRNEVKAWVTDNIERWIEEKSEWFDIGLVDEELIPIELLHTIKGNKTSQRRRRSSFAEEMDNYKKNRNESVNYFISHNQQQS